MMSPESEQPNAATAGVMASDETTEPQKSPSPLEEAAVADDKSHEGDSELGAKFAGKILYNPDGSTYIIEDADLGDNELPKQEGCIMDLGNEATTSSEANSYPQIANAFLVSNSSAYYNTIYGQAFVKLLQDRNVPETPIVHSYRVYSARNRQETSAAIPMSSSQQQSTLPTVVPVKPILMCFICKLSFGCAKSFASHCGDLHTLDLSEEEQSILDGKNSSAIVQYVGKEQELSISFLEPVSSPSHPAAPAPPASSSSNLAALIQASSKSSPPMSPGAIANFLSVAAAVQQAKAGSSLPTASSVPNISSDGEDSLMQPPSVSSKQEDHPELDSRSPNLTRYSSPSPSSVSSFPSTSQFPMTPNHTVTNANMLQGTTIGACLDHVNGRPTGVECAKCDLILSSSRMAGGSAWNVSRNSCKTLKCPKCNWHYKYQETLEIHMKEKHPESETTCIYCITGQQHPRLARGETYTCGYKPYRCEVCNYSTTTKGNLSIHMQSDKHLNNMQELQNGGPASTPDVSKISSSHVMSSPGGRPSMALPPTISPSKAQQQQQQQNSPKPNWRCDVCNYETNVARNLRIHMTSEKHTHNMMALSQQNAKSMQQLSALQQMTTGGGGIPGMDSKLLLQIQQGLGLMGVPTPASSAPVTSEAALADLAFNQAVLAQMMSAQFPQPGGGAAGGFNSDLNLAALAAAQAEAAGVGGPNAEDEAAAAATQEAMQEQQNEDQNAQTMFSCCVCRDFGCDSIDDLSTHLSLDRSRTREHEVSLFIGGHYLCQLCNYKTNLKANFQLHCKTDKHLQRLSHVNHIKEGGPSNEWKLRFLTSINPVELRCNACDFYTNSPHKLQVHVANQQHQAAAVLFNHLQRMEATIDEEYRSYDCILCQFSSRGKPALMGHVRTMKHLQMEQIHQLQKRADGNMAQTEIGDIFQVSDSYVCNESSSAAVDQEKSSSLTRDEKAGDDERESTQSPSCEVGGDPDTECRSCPLCSEKFPSQDRMESHAMSVHSVNSEGLQRLQSLINGSHWLNKKEGEYAGDSSDVADKKTNSSTFSYSMEKYMDPNRPFKCDVCKESFTQKNILLVHYNSVSHLHRLKKTMQEQQQHNQSASTSSATPEKSSKSSALEALLGNIRGEKKDDDEVKPFKCNICKVAYSQGSTLDIHIRSVLHQTKASKLQELILTGQIDMSKPLIEQPDPQQLQEQHKKMIADMLLSPKSLNSTGSSNPQTSPNVRSSSPGHSTTPQSSPLTNIQALMATKNESSGGGTTDEEKTTLKSLAKTFPMLSNLTSTPTSSAIDDKAPPVLKNLLQNYGLDLVKQFSEMHQKRQRDDSYGETAPQQPSKKKAKDEHQVRLNGDDSPPSGGGDRAATPAGSVSSNTDKESPNNNKGQPNLAEMQEALQRAMMGAQLQQMNPMMMQMAQLQGLNPLVAMNLYPPLIPPHLLKQGGGGGGQDLLAQLQSNPLFQAGGMDPKLLALMSATRPQMPPQMSEQPKNIAQMMGLLAQSQPMPQMNQDSKNFLQMAQMGFDPKMLEGFHAGPPNFNMQRSDGGGPGGLMLPQQPIAPQDQSKRARTRISDDQLKILRNNFDINNSPSEDTLNNMAQQTGLPLKVIKHWFRNTLFKERQKNKDSPYNFNNPPSTKLNLEEYEKTGESKVTPVDSSDQEEYIKYEAAKKEQDKESKLEDKSAVAAAMDSQNANANSKVPTTHTSSASVNDIISSSNMAEASLTLSRLLGSHLTPGALGGATGQQPPPLLPNFPAFPMTTSSLSTTPPMPEYLTTLARQNPRPQSPMSVGSNQGKRANRTRFTDYQIKVLQEFFENNAYPKDDDLEYLSKLLGLSPRVIVVWFQNARQKARKIYENQPPTEATEGDEASGRFTRTSGCNYQCKKCLLVFQRYYELIRHQKQHCYKEEDARKSALAQKAAGQAAASFVGPPPPLIPHSEEESRSSGGGGDDRSLTSPATPANMSIDHDRNALLNYPPHTPFGILQQQALHQQQQQQQQHQHQQQQQHQQQHQHLQQQLHNNPDSGDEFDESESLASSPSSKRKLSDDGDMDEESIQRREKRLRTTILPEQLDFLYQKYQVESNPSRKMLEQIATEVGLRKRVVQVWFQNTRARERKGHYRAQNQVINKRCPFCSAHFKVRSALEAHLATKHPDQPTGIVDIDALPNVDISSEDGDNNGGGGGTNRDTPPPPPFNMSDQIASLMPTTTTSAAAFDLQNSMRKYYEDTMKRFMNDLADQKQQHPEPSHQLNTSQSPNHHQQALDLTSSFNTEDCGSSDHGQGDGNDSDHNNRSIDGSSMGNGNSKRFRTQMSGVQVKMMKAIFEAYKTPTMTECSNLGREIGLQKRVVQVWFQNARAKEKRARLQLQQATGREPEGYMPPDHCIVCPGFTFGQRFAIQDHLFTKAHLENLRVALEQGRYDPESPGTKMAQAAAALQQSNGQGAVARPNSSNGPSDQTALSMLQMTTQVNNSHELLDIPARQNPRMLMQV